MSHPKNRRERHLLGVYNGIRRAEGIRCTGTFSKAWVIRHNQVLRNTTKICSCSMCGNPRRKNWKDKLTLQEKRFYAGEAGETPAYMGAD